LFGVATFGVHATAYTPDFRVWVPRRAKDKSTWPGYLDNSVAGGITAGDQMYESMVRECWEEAGLPEDVVRKHMRQTGVISYMFKTRHAGWIQPEVEFTYDIALPDASIQLRPEDGEAEDFRLMDREEVMERMRKGEFKPNCALVLIDFYIRHGFITAENCDCDYVALTCALHNDLRLPGP
jgi:isopentenyldiphosphate isomerase